MGADEKELTARALLGGALVGGILCFSNMYFGLQTGWVTMGSLQSALLGFGLFKALAPALPFTAKENVVLQTTAVAAATMPLSCGFVGIIPALQLLYKNEGKSIAIFSDPWALLIWCMALGFFGVFIAPPLRKQTILREKLQFPSGTATAEIIYVLHRLEKEDVRIFDNKKDDDAGDTNEMLELVNESAPLVRQSDPESNHSDYEIQSATRSSPTAEAPAWRALFISFFVSAAYTLMAKFVPITRNIPVANYIGMPILTTWSWTLQPSPSYVGQGLIMGPHTTLSMLVGAIIGWGILGPISKNKGWAPGEIHDVESGAAGWILWVSLSIMLADSAVSLSLLAGKVLFQRGKDTKEELDPAPPSQQITLKMWLPGLLLASCFSAFALSPMFGMPLIEPVVAVAFSLLVSALAIRALGETDLNPVSGIGKVSQLLFAVISPGNVVANLIAGAVAEAGAIAAGDLMQDLKTGHLLKSSPRAQFVGQIVGTASSCIFVVAAWMLYSSAYEIPGSIFLAPTAQIWLDMANVVNGQGHLAENVVPAAMIAAAVVVLLYALEGLVLPPNQKCLVPSSMAMAVGMYVSPNWTIPRVLGGVANHCWKRSSPAGAERYLLVVASGFVLGEGLASIANAVMTSAGYRSVWCVGCPTDFCAGCNA